MNNNSIKFRQDLNLIELNNKSFQELFRITLDFQLDRFLTYLIVGQFGIGKTYTIEQVLPSIVTEKALQAGIPDPVCKAFSVRLSAFSSEVLQGLALIDHGKVSILNAPFLIDINKWVETQKENGKTPFPIVFFDEYNRVSSQIRSLLFNFIERQETHNGLKLGQPIVLAAVNYGDGFVVDTFEDRAELDRFDFQIELRSDLEDWIDFMGEDLNPILKSFLIDRSNFFDPSGYETTDLFEQVISPRRWTKINNIINKFINDGIDLCSDIAKITFRSILPKRIAVELIDFIELIDQKPAIDKVFAGLIDFRDFFNPTIFEVDQVKTPDRIVQTVDFINKFDSLEDLNKAIKVEDKDRFVNLMFEFVKNANVNIINDEIRGKFSEISDQKMDFEF